MPLLLILLAVLALVLALIALEQYAFRLKKSNIPGPWFVPPFLGNCVPFLKAPWDFYRKQDRYGPVSWNSFFGKFVIFANTTEVARSVFMHPDLRLWLAPGAKEILGDEKNIAFMHGAPHKEIRTRMLPAFSRRALSVYLPIQEKMTYEHLRRWFSSDLSQPVQIWPMVRDLNIETSTQVFVGPYVPEAERTKFSECYLEMNNGFLTVPLNIPGTTFAKAVKARERLIEKLVTIVQRSRKEFLGLDKATRQPRCLLDVLVEEDTKYSEPTSDLDLAYHVLDFLFASQDASTSSLVWVFHLLAEYPEVLAKVREEQSRARPNGEPILSLDALQALPYTRQVVKEILRYRPPAIMVPHEVQGDTEVGSHFHAKKGSIVVPSVWHASFEGFINPDKFDPERFNSERREDVKFANNFLVFGCGAHMCMGKEYAVNHLHVFASIVAQMCEWDRVFAKGHDTIEFRPTIIPADGCVVRLRSRMPLPAKITDN